MSPKTITEAKKHNDNFSWIKWFSFGNGLIRPACASFRDEVANGIFYTNGLKELDSFLSSTFGRITMQEDIMRFLVNFCGYSGAESDNVRRFVAKKKGTEKLLPEIKARFIKCTHENYGVPIETCETMSDSIIQTIQDASAYGFSWNHSDAYSCLGYICAYLRYYHPMEFITTALNVFCEKEEKSQKIVKYAQKVGYKIEPPKFRKSIDTYTFEPGTNVIYKGLHSIKYISVESTMELFGLRMNKFDSFSDLLITILEETRVNGRQMRVLISLDFFSEFGKNKKLLDIFEKFVDRYKKTYVEKTKVKRIEEIKEFEAQCQNVSLSISEQIFAEREFMGYISYRTNCDKRYCYVLNLDNKFTPKVNIYCFLSGKVIECRVDKKFFKKNPFNIDDILYASKFSIKPEWAFQDGNYIRKGTSSYVLMEYKIVSLEEFDKILSRKADSTCDISAGRAVSPKTSYL